MENPIEHLDLGFVNYTQHPTNPKYMVYRFTDVNRANHFRELLNENKIEFQEDTQEKKQQTYTLFAIHQKNYKKTMKMYRTAVDDAQWSFMYVDLLSNPPKFYIRFEKEMT